MNEKPSISISQEVVRLAQKRLGNEYRYMGGVSEADYLDAILPVLDELHDRISKLEEAVKTKEGGI